MKKFKLIKEYPGSPKPGYIAKYTGNVWDDGVYFSYDINPEKYSEFWKEIIEKDYEILSFINGTTLLKGNNGYFRNPNDHISTGKGYAEKILLGQGHVKIHSVKRLSDGEIFTIGDKLDDFDVTAPISTFKIENDTCRVGVRELGTISLRSCKKVKQPLFTTEDGVDVFEGDHVYLVGQNFKWLCFLVNENIRYSGGKRFSTKEKAEEYILMNKPCLSINDVISVGGILNLARKNKLDEIVKSRL